MRRKKKKEKGEEEKTRGRGRGGKEEEGAWNPSKIPLLSMNYLICLVIPWWSVFLNSESIFTVQLLLKRSNHHLLQISKQIFNSFLCKSKVVTPVKFLSSHSAG